MSKPILVWCMAVGALGVAAGAIAQEARDRPVHMSILPSASHDVRVSPSGVRGTHPDSALVPEPYYVPPQPAVMPPLPSVSGPPATVVVDDNQSVSGQRCTGECHGTCSRHCVPMRHRLQAWWACKKACLQETHWGYPEEFEERPLGACVWAAQKTQVVNGMHAQMVLYHYDFHEGPTPATATLNPHGLRRLHEMVVMLQSNLWPVVIQPTGNPLLDSARRDRILELLREQTGAVPEEWVVVREPHPVGLSGEEAVAIYWNLLQQTKSGGAGAVTGKPMRTTIETFGSEY